MLIILVCNFKSIIVMKKQEKSSKKEIWKEIALDFWSLCQWCFSGGMNPAPKEKIQKKKIGMFYYAEDKSFSEELIPNKTVSGVVYHVDETGEHGLVVLLHQAWLPWLSDYLYVGIPQKGYGKENTRLILEFAQRQGLKAKAAEYCANYTYGRVKAGEAFLPSIDELKCLYKNKELVDEKLAMIKGKLAMIKGADLLDGCYYWSSSEYSDRDACELRFSDGNVDCCFKGCNTYVRPVVAF